MSEDPMGLSTHYLTRAQAKYLDELGRQRELAIAKFDAAMVAIARGISPTCRPLTVDTDELTMTVHELEAVDG